MGLTADIGKFLTGLRYAHIPAEAVPTVCRGFTDCVGVLIAGLPEPVTSIVAKSVGYAEPINTIADFSPSRIILSAARSLTDPLGLYHSALP